MHARLEGKREEATISSGDWRDSSQAVDRRGLPCAVGSEEAEELVLLEVQPESLNTLAEERKPSALETHEVGILRRELKTKKKKNYLHCVIRSSSAAFTAADGRRARISLSKAS